MNAIVFLLILLSITTLVSRQRIAGLRRTSLVAPVLILIAYAVSPEGLGLVLPSALHSMNPALRVGIFWIAFIVGLNFTVSDARVLSFRDVFQGVALLLLAAVLLWFGFDKHSFNWRTGAISLILTGIFLPGSALIAALAVAAGISIWVQQGLNPEILRYFGLIFGLAVLLSVCSRLVISSKTLAHSTTKLVLVGMVILGSGLAAKMEISEAVVGFLFGVGLMLLFHSPRNLPEGLKASEEPVTMMLYFFLGLHLRLDIFALALGGALAAIRLAVIYAFALPRQGRRQPDLSFSQLAAPLAISLFLSLSQDLKTSFYLSALTAGLIATELMALALPQPKLEEAPRAR
jgi:hypothetical protein